MALLTVAPTFASAAGRRVRNPLGLMIGGGSSTVRERLQLAKSLGVACFRPWDVTLDRWDGRHADAEAAARAGFKLVLTVRTDGRGGPPPTPSTPPHDLARYRQLVGAVLDAYHPAVLVVENEENSRLYYTGTPQEYGEELATACAEAHRRRIACTNGGLVSSLVASLVWDDYRRRGQPERAEAFARRAATGAQYDWLLSARGRQRIEQSIEQGRALLNVYQTVGIDYVNFHWYIPDPAALEEAVDFLYRVTGLQAMTNEIGQRDTDPATVSALLDKALDLELPYIVWYSLDRPDSQALQNPDGTLRPNGREFQRFVHETVPAPAAWASGISPDAAER